MLSIPLIIDQGLPCSTLLNTSLRFAVDTTTTSPQYFLEESSKALRSAGFTYPLYLHCINSGTFLQRGSFLSWGGMAIKS